MYLGVRIRTVIRVVFEEGVELKIVFLLHYVRCRLCTLSTFDLLLLGTGSV